MTTFYATVGDAGTVHSCILKADGAARDLDGATVQYQAKHPDSTTPITGAATLGVATGAVSYTLTGEQLAAPLIGTYELYWQVTFGDGEVATFPQPGHDTLVIRPQRA